MSNKPRITVVTDQVILAELLKVGKYRDGTPIFWVRDDKTWVSSSAPPKSVEVKP